MENSMMMKRPHAIVVALPLQGHVIPTVQLAIKLASKGFSITFINSEYIHHQIALSNPTSMGSTNDIFSEIRATSSLDIEYVTVSDGLPVEYDRSLNHDRWVAATIHCFPAHLEVAIAKVVKSRPSNQCFLVADAYSVWASEVANKFGLLYVAFWTEAALVLDLYFHVHLLQQNGHVGPGARKDAIDYIPGVNSIKPTDLTSYLQEEDLTTIRHQSVFTGINDAIKADFLLLNTVQELEADTIQALKALFPVYAIGPLVKPGFTKSPVATSLWAETNCTQWLDTKAPGSVLYVSFGSYAHISKEELAEIAHGIKLSGVNFLWIIRPDMVSSDESDPLPVGFRDEVGDRGMIVTWTTQVAVLAHRAIGGFLTHCGWNSVLEGMWYGVPMLCYPLLTDQFTNRKLVVDDWKVGCNLCEEKPISREEVSQQVRFLISEELGCELRQNIKRVQGMLENVVTSEGSTGKNIEGFLNDLNAAMEKR